MTFWRMLVFLAAFAAPPVADGMTLLVGPYAGAVAFVFIAAGAAFVTWKKDGFLALAACAALGFASMSLILYGSIGVVFAVVVSGTTSFLIGAGVRPFINLVRGPIK